ncbi:uncharacterized protein LOC121050041 [Rosa chinensis]|uniref:uncharacterized protein LOC121050041 n=1 Tax=Rosa chinensis TaxID=74649 RepID=UPI001AD8B1CC|nr:uncharacterized protein LOC121050041 [Rosa chinensis]
MDIGYQMAYRAKRRAVKLAQGSHEDQYNLLESYAHELKKKNPGTSVWIQTELDGDVTRFKRIYICLEPLKIGWRASCRPIIGLDGCHLKAMFVSHNLDIGKGKSFISWYQMAYRAKRRAVKLAQGSHEDQYNLIESYARELKKKNPGTSVWIQTELDGDVTRFKRIYICLEPLKIGWRKGLEQAFKDMFPFSEHRHCVQHLHNNFKGDGFGGLELKQKLWAVARAYAMRQYEHAMEELKISSVGAWGWCMDRPAKHWSKSHFKDTFKCDILLNNHSESFNKSLLQARKKPILGCLEDIKTSAMVRGRGVGCASGVITQHSVQLDKKSGSFRRWDVSGIPCGHAIAAIYSKGWSPDEFVDDHYRMEKYFKAYELVINPIAGVSEWEIIHRPIAAPLYRAQPGRPKLKRNKEPGEEPPPAGKAENELPTEDGANVLPPEDGANVQQQPEHENVQVPDNAETSTNIVHQPQPQDSSNPVFSGRRFKSPAKRIKPGKKPAEGSTSATNSRTDSRKPSWKY